MTRQQFHTADVLRLQIEDEWPGLPNLIPNPSGEFGTWGWLPNLEANLTAEAGPALRIVRTTGLPAEAQSDYLGVVPSSVVGGDKYVRGRITSVSDSGGTTGIAARFDFYGRNKAYVSSGPTTAVQTASGPFDVPAVKVPNNADLARLVVQLSASAVGLSVYFNTVCAVNGTLTEVNAATPTAEPDWVDLLSPATSLTITREGLSLGVLSATVRDSTLDPSQSAVIRKGKVVRVQALSDTAQWGYLFRGKLLNADVTYDLQHHDASRRARIQLLAVDPASVLANTPRPDGVQTINELGFLLAGIGVPWNINGAVNSKITATTVAHNDKASALDQVALTRDTTRGYAWLSRAGVVNAWDAATIPAVSLATLDEDDYSDLQLGFNTEDLINDVTVIVRSIDALTGETIETPYGPFSDEVSVREWGRYHVDFTVQASGWVAATAEAYALAILAANATPALRIKNVRLPVIDDVADLSSTGPAYRDLYDLVTVSNTAAALSHTARITQLKHTITPEKWLVDVGFTPNGAVASPQLTPALPPGPIDMPNTGWIAAPLAGGWSGSVQYRRLNGVVFVSVEVTKASWAVNEVVATLPLGFRPQITWYCPAAFDFTTTVTWRGWWVDTAGQVKGADGTRTNSIGGTACFPAAP